MRICFAPASVAGALLLAACAGDGAPSASNAGQPASATEPTRSRCFRPSQVNGWRAGDRDVVYVRTDVRRVFRMQLMGPCPDVNWAQGIGIEARGSSWICSGIDATITRAAGNSRDLTSRSYTRPERATARIPVVRVSPSVYDALGPSVTVTGDRGSVTLPAIIADIADDVVWLPGNSVGRGVLAGIGLPGSTVTLKGADA